MPVKFVEIDTSKLPHSQWNLFLVYEHK